MTDCDGRYWIVVVCLGNICRSPMAASILTDRFARAGLGYRVSVTSAGTGGWNVGRPIDPRARVTLQRSGYSSEHRARQFQRDWFSEADLVIGMDYSNVQDLRGMTRDEDDVTKVMLLRSFSPQLVHLPEDDPGLEIPDPYYGSELDFKRTAAMIEDAVDGVVDYVRLALH